MCVCVCQFIIKSSARDACIVHPFSSISCIHSFFFVSSVCKKQLSLTFILLKKNRSKNAYYLISIYKKNFFFLYTVFVTCHMFFLHDAIQIILTSVQACACSHSALTNANCGTFMTAISGCILHSVQLWPCFGLLSMVVIKCERVS